MSKVLKANTWDQINKLSQSTAAVLVCLPGDMCLLLFMYRPIVADDKHDSGDPNAEYVCRFYIDCC